MAGEPTADGPAVGPSAGARLLLVHAHPDDETITTGGTIAHYADAGAEVTVVTCTLGEEGEVIGDTWAHLAADEADQLGGYRIAELSAALGRLSPRAGEALRPRFLGGAGRWRDSGMVGTPSARHPRAFIQADESQVVTELAEVICEKRPHVVVTYDPHGGYGHPDHIHAHEATMAAVQHSRDTWEVPKLYWTVADVEAVDSGIADLGDVPEAWTMPQSGDLPGVPAADVTAEIDIAGVLDRKRAALAAHATQVQVAPGGAAYALSNMVAQPIVPREFFMLVQGAAGETNGAGRETDLLSGIDLGR